MSLYAYYGNNNTDRSGKLRIFICNECGSFDLCDPRNSESDHRDVLRFTCNKCGIIPYWSWMNTYDVIKVTKLNKDMILKEMCKTHGWDPEYREWRQDVLDSMDDE
jgi:hypothetical protein